MEPKFSDLKGKTLSKFEGQKDGESIKLSTTDGEVFELYHDQDCCESVTVDDICGDVQDILRHPILAAEEVTNDNHNPDGVPVPEYQDSFTWTFYKLSTIKGSVTIRWYGESNGYYSEYVDFRRVS